jgi:hypothetical protein
MERLPSIPAENSHRRQTVTHLEVVNDRLSIEEVIGHDEEVPLMENKKHDGLVIPGEVSDLEQNS